MNINVIHSELKPIIQRLTKINLSKDGESQSIYVFETIGRNGESYEDKIQNWECENITDSFNQEEQKEIFNACKNYWKTVE